MSAAWAPTAHKAGLRTLLIEPVSHLDVAVLSRREGLTPAAQAFLKVAQVHVAMGPADGSAHSETPGWQTDQ
jgi:hypothetical protein